MTDINEIAAQAKEGFAKSIGGGWEILSQYYADIIEITHVPPIPTDGPVAGVMAAGYIQHMAVALSNLKDFSCTNEVRAEGQQITQVTAQHFRGVDGKPVTFHGKLVFQFENGRIVRLISTDGDTHAQLVEAVAATGPLMASPWRDRDQYSPVKTPPSE